VIARLQSSKREKVQPQLANSCKDTFVTVSSPFCGCALVFRAAAQTRAPACDCRILSALEPRTARVVRSSRSAPPPTASSPHSSCMPTSWSGSGCILRTEFCRHGQTERGATRPSVARSALLSRVIVQPQAVICEPGWMRVCVRPTQQPLAV
jgi:hypothetical protein